MRECVCVCILIKERLLRYLYLVATSDLSFYVITVQELPACKLWETGCMYVVFSNLDSRSYYTDRDCRFLCFEFLSLIIFYYFRLSFYLFIHIKSVFLNSNTLNYRIFTRKKD